MRFTSLAILLPYVAGMVIAAPVTELNNKIKIIVTDPIAFKRALFQWCFDEAKISGSDYISHAWYENQNNFGCNIENIETGITTSRRAKFYAKYPGHGK